MSKFIERHKRKSLLAALLLMFRGRTKYLALSLVIVAFSVPFVVSGDMVSKFIDLPSVRSILKLTGLSSVLSSIYPNYSKDIIKSALEQVASESDRYSIWQKFLQGLAGNSGDYNGRGTVAMVKVGDLYEEKEGKYSNGKIKVLGKDEKSQGESADAVNFADLANMDPNQGDIGGFGGGGLGYGATINRNLIKGGGSISSKEEGILNSALNSFNYQEKTGKGKTGKIVKDKSKMGKVSGFTWKNVGVKGKGKNMDVRLSTHRKALFQMAETFTMTAAAYKMNKVYEYQASYTGSTYDGNKIDADVITTNGAPELPNTGFTGDLMNSAGAWSQLAKDCSNAQENEGKQYSYHLKQIQEIQKGMDSPPKCCDYGAVDSWNGKVEQMKYHCIQANANVAVVSAKCQSPNQQADCNGQYNPMKIKKCSKLKCWLGIILAILMIAVGAILIATEFGVAIGTGLVVAGASMFLGQLIGGTPGAICSIIGGVVAFFLTAGAASLAITTSLIITSAVTSTIAQYAGQAISKTDDGSNAINN